LGGNPVSPKNSVSFETLSWRPPLVGGLGVAGKRFPEKLEPNEDKRFVE
jgi:hypothetical protein